MQSVATTSDLDYYTRAANEDCFYGGPRTRTKYTYDGDGNMKTGNGRTATYTSFDMPLTITESGASDAFIYGPEHQRVKRTTASTVTIYVDPDSAGGLAYEKDMTTASAIIEDRVYISAGGDPVVLLKRANGTGSFVPYYLHRDPIGSTVAITSPTAAVLERLSYEPFGKRRAPDGASDPTDAIKGVNSDRGFTDHEHLDDVALIHMNGRVFDPLVSRFLSADPNVQSGYDQQSYNRYSYVSNNPLNARDPTGYFSFFDGFSAALGSAGGIDPIGGLASYELHKATVQYLAAHQWAYSIAEVAVAAATAYYCGGCGEAMLSSDVAYAQTGSYHDALKAGAITYASYYAFQAAGNNIFENAAVGCAVSAASGGKCKSGALAAGFSTAARVYGGKYTDGVIQQAVIGGTASVLGRGRFANGAVTGAFGYIIQDPATNGPEALGDIADLAGKLWTLPNSALGLVLGIAGLPFGDSIGISSAYNAITVTNFPIGGGALTLGNVIVTTESSLDVTYPTYAAMPAYVASGGVMPTDSGSLVNLGSHESGHTYQYQLFGPLFLPAYFISGGISGSNSFEIHADQYGQTGKGWLP